MYTTPWQLHLGSVSRMIEVVGTTLAAVRGKVAGTGSLADRGGMIAMLVLDIQLLIGCVIFSSSARTCGAILTNFGSAMN